jgi:hypothetical protein
VFAACLPAHLILITFVFKFFMPEPGSRQLPLQPCQSTKFNFPSCPFRSLVPFPFRSFVPSPFRCLVLGPSSLKPAFHPLVLVPSSLKLLFRSLGPSSLKPPFHPLVFVLSSLKPPFRSRSFLAQASVSSLFAQASLLLSCLCVAQASVPLCCRLRRSSLRFALPPPSLSLTSVPLRLPSCRPCASAFLH